MFAVLVVLQLALDHTNHDLVRNQFTLVHDLFGFPTEIGLGGDLGAKHVTGGQVTAAEALLDLRRLSSLSYVTRPMSVEGRTISGHNREAHVH